MTNEVKQVGGEMSEQAYIITRIKSAEFLAKVHNEMSIFSDADKRAKRYVRRCLSWLKQTESAFNSANIAKKYANELCQYLFRYAARDAMIGDEIIIYGSPQAKKKFTVIETVKYTLRLLQGEKGFVVHRPISVLKGDKFHVKLDTLQADKMQIVFEPNLEASRKVTEKNLRAVLVPYQVGGVTGTVTVYKETIDEAKNASKNLSSSDSPWKTWYESMVNKTALRQALKVMPVPADLLTELDEDPMNVEGRFVDDEQGAIEDKTPAALPQKSQEEAPKKPGRKKAENADPAPPEEKGEEPAAEAQEEEEEEQSDDPPWDGEGESGGDDF